MDVGHTVRSIGEMFDLVLIDTPALLSSSKALGVAGQADAVVLVVAHRVALSRLRDVRDRLAFVKTPLIGYVYVRPRRPRHPHPLEATQATPAKERSRDPQGRQGAGGTILSETGGTTTRVAAVLTAYNRRDLTLACLRSLQAQQLPGVTLDLFVLDDASSDGTSEQIAEQFPEVTLLHGNGQLYWNGGMRRAFAAAMAGDYDYYLWMNDDTHLDDGALAVLLDTECRLRAGGEGALIVAGSTRHPETGELTYGGVVHPYRWRPLKSVLVQPGDTPSPCDTMNGNVALISRAVVQRVGNVDPAFVQQMADFDYGLRARAAGCSVWVAPGTVGTCAPHPTASPGRAAPRRGAAAAVVGQGTEARAVGGLQPAVGGHALAPVLAEPVCAPARPGSSSSARRLAGRGAARSERADVDTGEAHDQRLDGPDRRDGPSLRARAASELRWRLGSLILGPPDLRS